MVTVTFARIVERTINFSINYCDYSQLKVGTSGSGNIIDAWKDWRRVMKQNTLSATAQLIGYTIIKLFDESFRATELQLSVSKIMWACNSRSRSNVHRAVNELINAKAVLVNKGDKQSPVNVFVAVTRDRRNRYANRYAKHGNRYANRYTLYI